MKLIIVESPAKGRTIEKYLGPDYKVVASFGHVRDLPKKDLAIDLNKNFEPNYVIIPRARKNLKIIKETAKSAEELYLATDYDREGEAIAWHLVKALGFDEVKSLKLKVKRITFHEITKPAIEEALKHPREIDLNLVDAQQARRVLDRLVGYKLSPFLWKKVAQGLSAGRVQSVAVRLVVEREREIEKFKKDEYWTIEAIFSKNKSQFGAILIEKDGKKLAKLEIKTEKDGQKILDDLKNQDYKVLEIKKETKKRYPSPPFTTSTLQQEASAKLSYSPRQTMRLAQELYEKGLITYMRTDSVSVSALAQNAAQKVIKEKFGSEYALATPRFYKTKTKGAQEAHEAIRPTNIANDKIALGGGLERLYELIWKRMVASQMKEAEFLEANVRIGSENAVFRAVGLEMKFPGFLRLYSNSEDKILPELKVGEKLNLEKLEKNQHFTEPPARYSEAALIRELEKRGIGRPSTYAPTLATITDRGYVQKVEGKLQPQEIGKVVNDLLVEHFPEIVDYDFTAQLEGELDEIAEGKVRWNKVIGDFYGPFSKNLSKKFVSVDKADLSQETDEKCPDCSKPLKIKLGRYGKFMACSGFPDCKYTRPMVAEIKEEVKEKCPKCGQMMVLKEGKFGPFLACSAYPKCKTTKTLEIAAKVPCPNCGAKLLKKRSKKGRFFWGCAGFPKCKTAFWDEPIDQKCEKCGNLMTKDKKGSIKCSECK